MIEKKIAIGKKYGLIKSEYLPDELVEENLSVIDGLSSGRSSFFAAQGKVLNNLKKCKREISIDEMNDDLWDVFKVGLLEFHITDRCDQACPHCYYGSGPEGSQATIPIEEFQKLKLINPKAIVITGGGEPTIYNYNGINFTQAMAVIRELLPDVQLGMQTNGTVFPRGNWSNNFLYQRSSIDADKTETFALLKGANFFDKIVNNMPLFIKTNIPFVGVGFLFEKNNVDEIPAFIERMYSLVKQEAPEAIRKFTIQFRPFGPDLTALEEVRSDIKNHQEGITESQINNVRNKVEKLCLRSKELNNFIRQNTNVEEIYKGNSGHPLVEFDNCYISLAYRMNRAGGNNFPCFILVQHMEFCMGNFFGKDPKNDYDAYLRIALLTYRFYNCRTKYCNSRFCRQAEVNRSAQLGLKEDPMDANNSFKVYFF
jgi:MoaA/NifB/PqqE/SkfB family radical SAM enzyme